MATASMETSQSERTVIGLVIAHALLMAAAAAGLPAVAGAQTGRSNAVYVAHLSALNTTVTGVKAVGEATFTIKGDSLTIAVNASGLPGTLGGRERRRHHRRGRDGGGDGDDDGAVQR